MVERRAADLITPPRTLFGRPVGLGLILIQKTLWAVALLGLAGALLAFHAAGVTQPLQEIFEGELTQDPHDLLATILIGLVPAVSPRAELLLAGGAALYALLEGIEVWGLWRDLRWVEVFIVVETAALLPYEGWELVRHPSPFKGLTLVLNALIVGYLAARYLQRRAADGANNSAE